MKNKAQEKGVVSIEKRRYYSKGRAPLIDIRKPGRLRVLNVIALLGVSHSTFYAGLKKGRYPQPDGKQGDSPYWFTETIRPLLMPVADKVKDVPKPVRHRQYGALRLADVMTKMRDKLKSMGAHDIVIAANFPYENHVANATLAEITVDSLFGVRRVAAVVERKAEREINTRLQAATPGD